MWIGVGSMKINIITLGCSKNVVDSENIGGHLRKAGFQLYYDRSRQDCDITIVNTCGFIGDAKEESINTLLEQAEIKRHARKNHRLIAVGCLIQRYQKELQQEIPDIDAFYGVHAWNDLIGSLIQMQKDEAAHRVTASGREGKYMASFASERVLSTPRHYAFLKIAEGCNRQCSYCAIPGIRGGFVSRPLDELVEEGKALVMQGVKEIIVIAQDTTHYGVDLYGRRMLGTLLERLATESGAHWIRLHYTYPTDFPLDAVQAMRNHDNICNYIDIPLQHIDSRILRSMQRGIDREGTIRLLRHFREMLPDAVIRTTFIAGYPGETEEEFQELKQFVKEARFDRMGVFAYSSEEGTPAATLADDVPDDEKQRRVSELMAVQEQISLEKNEARVGKVYEVLVDSKEGDYYVGRTQYDSPEVDDEVLIPVSGTLEVRVGRFYHVRITEAMENDLLGEVIVNN